MLALAAGPDHADFTELITLPNLTWEGRTCRAIRIHRGSAVAGRGVYFLGGIHAREWGSPAICINFVRLLTDGCCAGTGITQGGKSFSVAEIRTIVEQTGGSLGIQWGRLHDDMSDPNHAASVAGNFGRDRSPPDRDAALSSVDPLSSCAGHPPGIGYPCPRHLA